MLLPVDQLWRDQLLRIGRWAVLGSLGLLVGLATAAEHPRLLIPAADVPRLRHACGVETGLPPAEDWGKAGRFANDYQALRAYFAKHVAGDPLPGELLAAAFVHLIDPHDSADAQRVNFVNAALRGAGPRTVDSLELLLALDWCWGDADPAARRDFALALREHAEPLTAADSPLEPKRFRERLAALALAEIIDETDDPSPSWKTLRTRLLDAGQAYFDTTLPTFVKWRGLSPTGPGVAAREESDSALALEIGSAATGRDLWNDNRATVGRWLEHYALATMEHPALQHDFLHDDGAQAALLPATSVRELLPLTAHLIAARTGDPSAALVADRVGATFSASPEDLTGLWRWVPIVLDLAGKPRCDVTRLPLARNLEGAVIFRGGQGLDATAVWIDAGQPFLRRRQHFDAGHFVIERGGHLANYAGDDVAYEAVPSKGGFQRLDDQKEPFDFEQFFTSTIAHNCLLCWDASWISRWYGAIYQPAGGQRCIEGTCSDFVTPLAGQKRLTARVLAYGQNATAGYLSLDLAPAYDARAVSAYSREFVFFGGRALLVIDRVQLAYSRTVPTWIVNVPARPQVDGQDLQDAARVQGTTSDAGVWHYDAANWLHWTERDGGLWLTSLAPAPRRLKMVGGPAQPLKIASGDLAGRPYVGGDSQGFERLIIPAERHGALNAWYRLGTPTLLGPEFDKAPHWGRVEIEPADRKFVHVFVTLLVTDRADAKEPPTAEMRETDGQLEMTIQLGPERARLELASGMERGGTIRSGGADAAGWTLPNEVQPDAPLK